MKKLIGESIFLLSEHVFGDMTARYITDTTGQVGLWLFPTAMTQLLATRRVTLAGERWVRDDLKAREAIVVEPLVHLKLEEDNPPDEFGQGRTLKWAPSNDRFVLHRQIVEADAVITVLGDEAGLVIEHRLYTGPYHQTICCETKFINHSPESVKLEMLTSFALSGITPFAADDAPNRLVVHRFKSVWSAEGRLVSESIEDMHLERTWAGRTHLSERFGQVGSMPSKGWFPTVLVEDTDAGVIWGARMGIPTSWQMEVGRRHDDLGLSGGLADLEFGHWKKTVEPGEAFTAPVAWLTCVRGQVDDACARLVSVDVPATDLLPDVEKDLPVIYNDWGTSWGNPREEQILAVADRIAPLGIRYMIIDAGWYMPVKTGAKWATGFGDWEAHRDRFPKGLAAAAEAIRERGMIPGIWCEPEHVAMEARAFHDTDHLLRRNGKPLTIGVRRAWDLQDESALAYIDEKIVRLLKEAGFGYFKWDYSETLGLGVDHPDGLGEGLRVHGEQMVALFDRFRSALPELVIEVCSAGGNRLVSSFLQRGSMSSFSDAHEVVEIPIVAAALHRLILPRQSQIWAVLNSRDDRQRLEYSLSSTFLGRMCLSGGIHELSDEQLTFVQQAIDFYHRCVPVLINGVSHLIECRKSSWRHPIGWQAVIRIAEERGMVVVHSFEKVPKNIEVELPEGDWSIVDCLTSIPVSMDDNKLLMEAMPEFAAQVIMIEKA